MSKSVLIIGANGRLGQALAHAFLAGGWRVMGQVRRDPLPVGALRDVVLIHVAADDPGELATAAGTADVVIHAANPPYPLWKSEALPLAKDAIETAKRLGALLMFPGNVYNFGNRMPEILLESTAAQPTARKGKIRVDIENALREAARAGLRAVIIRAGDFFGGPGRGAWFDTVIAKPLRKGRIVYPGPLDRMHAWAYLPDLARTFVMVAERRSALSVFETLHFAGHAATGQALLDALARSARRLSLIDAKASVRAGGFPWAFVRVGGVVVPMWRELAEMRYLWDVPHRLSGKRLQQLIGDPASTTLDAAIDATLQELFGARATARADV